MKNKHLTISDRNDIQMGIEQLKTFSAIAVKIGKEPSTISKEARRNRVVKENSVTPNCESCPLLKKAPYVCNACPKKRLNCGYTRLFYYAKRAQLDYEAKLSELRTGVTNSMKWTLLSLLPYKKDKTLTISLPPTNFQPPDFYLSLP